MLYTCYSITNIYKVGIIFNEYESVRHFTCTSIYNILYLCSSAATIKQGQPVWASIAYSSQHVQLCANKTASQMLPNVPLMPRSLFHWSECILKLCYRSRLIKYSHSKHSENLILKQNIQGSNLMTDWSNTNKCFNFLFIEDFTHIHSEHYYFYKTT